MDTVSDGHIYNGHSITASNNNNCWAMCNVLYLYRRYMCHHTKMTGTITKGSSLCTCPSSVHVRMYSLDRTGLRHLVTNGSIQLMVLITGRA